MLIPRTTRTTTAKVLREMRQRLKRSPTNPPPEPNRWPQPMDGAK